MATAEDRIWVLLDDRAGNRAQALGVAERLGRPYRALDVGYGPLAALPNALLGRTCLGLDAASKAQLQPPWPALVIAAGRRTAPMARWIKAHGEGTRLVQIMDPGAGRGDFDLVCRPLHDGGTAAANVFEMAAAPHRLTRARLDQEAAIWASAAADLPAPRIALVVGGATRRRAFSDAMAEDLGNKASASANALGGSLMVTTSRRTGDAVEALAGALSAPHVLYRWDQGGDNPYLGYLGLADAVIVTGESVSMSSEASATGKPVYLYAPPSLITAKHGRLHAALYAGGYARPFEGAVDLQWSPADLDVAGAVAAEIEKRGLLP